MQYFAQTLHDIDLPIVFPAVNIRFWIKQIYKLINSTIGIVLSKKRHVQTQSQQDKTWQEKAREGRIMTIAQYELCIIHRCLARLLLI